MPFVVSADEVRRLVCISLEGAVGDADLIQLSHAVRREPAFISGWPVLYDCTAVTEKRITAALVRSLGAAGRADQNLMAFVTPDATAFGLARMYQITSDGGPDRIRVFSAQDEALAWLESMQQTA